MIMANSVPPSLRLQSSLHAQSIQSNAHHQFERHASIEQCLLTLRKFVASCPNISKDWARATANLQNLKQLNITRSKGPTHEFALGQFRQFCAQLENPELNINDRVNW
ncbi:MAG TPA: hypothetical protein VFV48_00645, partial [Pseudomonadales bacterium]|nr:hypothetical protein [Pseudomonadales bacterium]